MKQDSSWRKILDKLLPEFLAFYFPEIYQAIDFEKGIEFLDKELQKILAKSDDTGKRVVDKLIKVFLKDGGESRLLVHVEVQGYHDTDFPYRVYHCNYRIQDRFGKDVISVALLTDENPNFRKNVYKVKKWGFLLYFRFPVVKLLDYRDRQSDLEHDSNPFAIATLAFLKTVETKGNDRKRYQWKKRFLVQLFREGMTRTAILALYEFIDIVMALPPEDDKKLHEFMIKTTKEKKMSILTTAERVGLEKGERKGERKGVRQGIGDILEIKFGVNDLTLFKQIEQISDIDMLQAVRNGLKKAPTLEKAREIILAHSQNPDESKPN